MDDISISESVRRSLRAALLEERDFIDSIRRHPHEAVAGEPGSYRCRCTVAVRRPLDPETAELREVEVLLQRLASGWVVAEVAGLSSELEGGDAETPAGPEDPAG